MDIAPTLAMDMENLATALLAPRPWWQWLVPPVGHAERLRYLASRVRKLERALDDIAADAMEDEREAFARQEAKDRAIQRGQVVRLTRKVSLHMAGGSAA
jgi:hypothetical protein